MVFKTMVFITIVLHIIATVVSLRLTRRTKYNVSWVLITIGFAILLSRRIIEALPFLIEFDPVEYRMAYVWLGIFSSLCLAVGLILVGRIFKYMERMETEKRETEKKFLAVTIQAEERERSRISKDIHDGLGPLLSTIKMSISALKKGWDKPNAAKILDNVDVITNEAIKSIKDISDNLSPHVIENFGLVKALNNFIQKINATKTIKIHFADKLNNYRPHNDIEIVLYRVICELISNTVKHAEAKNIYIALNHDGKSMYMDYQDDGVGFEVDSLFKPQAKGMGYYSIFSRIKSINGEVVTNSSSEKGTRIIISIPL
ncbi:MAG TPA: sensor histidine kinase [Tenuifilaceae bacterium]|jgi:signal transduction histidine kinase|nr:sensor histidine kinase [Tenuifilaceae bacterium]